MKELAKLANEGLRWAKQAQVDAKEEARRRKFERVQERRRREVHEHSIVCCVACLHALQLTSRAPFRDKKEMKSGAGGANKKVREVVEKFPVRVVPATVSFDDWPIRFSLTGFPGGGGFPGGRGFPGGGRGRGGGRQRKKNKTPDPYKVLVSAMERARVHSRCSPEIDACHRTCFVPNRDWSRSCQTQMLMRQTNTNTRVCCGMDCAQGVPKTASMRQIKKAYHKLARKWHPDKHRECRVNGLTDSRWLV